MATFTSGNVLPQSEEACVDWGGEFRGKICARVKVSDGSVKICVRGEARRLGSFDECFNVIDACYTLIDAGIGKLKVCLENIEIVDGLPRCFTIKLIVDPVFGSDITLVRERFCLFGILAKQNSEGPLLENAGATGEDLVMMLTVNVCDC